MTTKDVGLITALHTLGIKEISIDDSNPREIYFTFGGDEVAKIAGDFYSDSLMVSALSYHQAFKKLKTLIHYLKDKNETEGYFYR